MKIRSKLSLTLLLIVLVPLILGMVTLYQSSKSSIQAIQESSAQRYASTVRDRLAAYFDKWKVTVDSISRMPSLQATKMSASQLTPLVTKRKVPP